MLSPFPHLLQIFHFPALRLFFGLSICRVVNSIELFPYLCLRPLFDQRCQGLSPFLLLLYDFVLDLTPEWDLGVSETVPLDQHTYHQQEPSSLLDLSISYLQYLVIKSPSSRTWHHSLTFDPSVPFSISAWEMSIRSLSSLYFVPVSGPFRAYSSSLQEQF